MSGTSIFLGAVVGGLASLPLIAISYLGNRLAGLPFIPFDFFEWLSRILPGRIVILSIDTIVRAILLLNLGSLDTTAKLIEQAIGILLIVGIGVVMGAVIAWALRRERPWRSWPGWHIGLIAGAILLLGLIGAEVGLDASKASRLADFIWLGALVLGWGASVGAVLEAAGRDLSPSPAVPGVTASAARAVPVPNGLAGEEAASAAGVRTTSANPGMDRRAFLVRAAGGAIGLAAAAGGAAYLLGEQKTVVAAPPATPVGGAAAGAVSAGARPASGGTPIPGAVLRDILPPAPGTRPELTDNRHFYRIDIDLAPPIINEPDWHVQVRGLFDRPRNLTLADLKTFPAVTQAITLSCISNPVGGDLISTSNWTGARLRDVLQNLGLKSEAKGLFLQAADGFYETVVLQDMMDPRTMLVYEMNGEPLPQAHGFPLRIYIPNRYGMKQPKWIISMEAINHENPGYWVERGWSATAHPQIVSVIDTVAKDHVENGRVPVGGIAWAGDRGIRSIEIQVDDGPWMAASLRTPPLSGLTWIQWRYDWPVVPGTHVFRVRATDGTGAMQISDSADTYPDGATGYHSVKVRF